MDQSIISLFDDDESTAPSAAAARPTAAGRWTGRNAAAAAAAVDAWAYLPAEVEDGSSTEYKLHLVSPKSRLPGLVTQLVWRLREGGGAATYYIGVTDNGAPVGLPRQQLDASLLTLKSMAAEADATICKIIERPVPSSTPSNCSSSASLTSKAVVDASWYFAEVFLTAGSGARGFGEQDAGPHHKTSALVRRNKWTAPRALRVALLGASGAGKSTLVAVLTSGAYDDGSGSARFRVARHRHEVLEGRTSSSAAHILAFDTNGAVLNYGDARSGGGIGAAPALSAMEADVPTAHGVLNETPANAARHRAVTATDARLLTSSSGSSLSMLLTSNGAAATSSPTRKGGECSVPRTPQRRFRRSPRGPALPDTPSSSTYDAAVIPDMLISRAVTPAALFRRAASVAALIDLPGDARFFSRGAVSGALAAAPDVLLLTVALAPPRIDGPYALSQEELQHVQLAVALVSCCATPSDQQAPDSDGVHARHVPRSTSSTLCVVITKADGAEAAPRNVNMAAFEQSLDDRVRRTLSAVETALNDAVVGSGTFNVAAPASAVVAQGSKLKLGLVTDIADARKAAQAMDTQNGAPAMVATGMADSINSCAHVPAFVVSNVSGAGVSPLLAFLETHATLAKRHAAVVGDPTCHDSHKVGAPVDLVTVMSVDSVLDVRGDVVIAGLLCGASVAVGDELSLGPSARGLFMRVTVSSIHAHHAAADGADGGALVALRLEGAGSDPGFDPYTASAVRRGQLVVGVRTHLAHATGGTKCSLAGPEPASGGGGAPASSVSLDLHWERDSSVQVCGVGVAPPNSDLQQHDALGLRASATIGLLVPRHLLPLLLRGTPLMLHCGAVRQAARVVSAEHTSRELNGFNYDRVTVTFCHRAEMLVPGWPVIMLTYGATVDVVRAVVEWVHTSPSSALDDTALSTPRRSQVAVAAAIKPAHGVHIAPLRPMVAATALRSISAPPRYTDQA